MFTGIITDIAAVSNLQKQNNEDLLICLKITNRPNFSRNLEIGCSIACNGICLTLIELKNFEEKTNFLAYFQASSETIDRTNIKNWEIGSKINIEFALKIGDELGGHWVSGHIDDIAQVKSIAKIAQSHRFEFSISQKLSKFICEKGSITLNGVSLTVNQVSNDSFAVNIIDHTFNHTNFGFLKIGDKVNLEIDQISRYLNRLLEFKS